MRITRITLPVVTAAIMLAPTTTLAQDAANTAAATASVWGPALAFLGAALAVALACIGSSIGVSVTGQAGAGLLTEKPGLAGKVIVLTALPSSQGLYGMVAVLLFIFQHAEKLTAGITFTAGMMYFAAFIPVAISCLTSAPLQAKVCAAGMHMLAKDEGSTGRVITLAALVETYALVGFLITFFMLNALA